MAGSGADHDRRLSHRYRPESMPEDDLAEAESTAGIPLELRQGSDG
jgi:hypothetical protein